MEDLNSRENGKRLFGFNREILRRGDLTFEQEGHIRELWDSVRFPDSVGESSSYSNVWNFFDFHNRADEQIQFLECAEEVGGGMRGEGEI